MTPTMLDSDLRSGDHLCAIYDTDADWLVTAVAYFGEGLARHEACVYVAPEANAAHLEVALRAAGLDVDAHVRRGALRFATPEATYLRPGRFDPDVMIALWQDLIDAAGAEGYTNLRVAGFPTWINDGVPGAERWAEYEAQVSECFRGRRLIKLCQYDRRLFSPTVLLDVLRSHPFAVVQGAVRANPFAGMAGARAERDRRSLDQDLEEALARERAARSAAEAACRQKDEFIAVFSHELRTPLAAAVVASALIERLSSDDPRAITAREVLGRQLEQARRLIDDLLDIERVNAGKIELTPERIDLAALVRDSVTGILLPTHAFELDARTAWVVGDAGRLRQVVENLITNAMKHTPAGGRIAVSTVQEDDEIVLRVDDSGAGMPAELLDRYQRTATERSALELARALMTAVDEALRSTITTLEALTTVRSLEDEDLRAFDREVRRVLTTQPEWMDVILLAPDGRQLIHTGRPWGTSLPTAAEPASVEQVVATRRPAVGSIARGRLGGDYAIPVRVPVIHRDRVVFVLTAVVKPQSIVDVLARQRMPGDWVGTVFDRRKNVVARTRNLEQFLGRPISAEFAALIEAPPQTWQVTHTLEGAPVYTAWARSAQSGWGVGLGIPKAAVETPLRRSLLTVAAGGLACAIVALGVALLVGRRITQPIVALASAAKAFGQQDVAMPSRASTVQEVEDVRRAFADAAALVQERAAEAAEANRAKDEFLAVLSHELRTPLNAVYGWARMLQSGQISGERVARALDVIVRQSNAQVQLIDDLLDVSRMITGKMRLDVRPVDLKGVVEQALDAARPAAEAKEIRIQSMLDPRAGPVSGDPDRLQQVVWNLVLNAVKFTPKGGRVQVRVQRVESRVEIVVTDTGQGIAPDVLPFVFDRFRQADSSSRRAHTGLGLGLALVKHLVELHGGSVRAESAGEGRGATFVVTLPLASEAAGDYGAGVHATRIDAPRSRLSLTGLRVLVVDDDPEALELATAILAAAGAVVRISASASEALDTVRAWRPDVLISDIEMPSEDGYWLIHRVRAFDEAEGGLTPAVALTAYGRVQDRTRALSAGYNMHVPKPVDPGELVAIVASVAGRAAI